MEEIMGHAGHFTVSVTFLSRQLHRSTKAHSAFNSVKPRIKTISFSCRTSTDMG
jgi:hypothetical protein